MHNETTMYEKPRKIQTSSENGFMNENVDGGLTVGFPYRIAIPRDIKDGVKSATLMRSEVTVRSVIARSAVCKIQMKTNDFDRRKETFFTYTVHYGT